jgi:nucleotide-binding universal stress UspA family protein
MFKTLVYAMDGTESEAALPTVRELADRFMSRIVIVHVREMVAGRAHLPYRADERKIEVRLHELVEQLRAEGIDASLEMHSVVGGRAARIISEVAEQQNADLIVVATRGHSPVLGVLTGSVTQRLLHSAPCPVLAVPARAASAAKAEPIAA